MTQKMVIMISFTDKTYQSDQTNLPLKCDTLFKGILCLNQFTKNWSYTDAVFETLTFYKQSSLIYHRMMRSYSTSNSGKLLCRKILLYATW